MGTTNKHTHTHTHRKERAHMPTRTYTHTQQCKERERERERERESCREACREVDDGGMTDSAVGDASGGRGPFACCSLSLVFSMKKFGKKYFVVYVIRS